MASGTSGGAAKLLRRYGPFVVVIALVGGIVAVSSGGGGDDDATDTTSKPGSATSDLPLTFDEAKDQGIEIDFGPGCDTETGRIMIPTLNAAPCVEPWDASKGNSGATTQGVTEDEIVIAVYKGVPDPLQQALVGSAGGSTDPEDTYQTAVQYLQMLEDVYETYGRKLKIVKVEATGGPADAAAAKADGIKVAEEIKPFAAISGPTQTPAYWQELAKAGIVCVGLCSLAETWETIEANAPYLWPTGPSPEQADQHLLELVGKQLVGKPAEFAGDPELQSQERVFGWVQAETETGEYTPRNDAFEKNLKDQYDGEIAERVTYFFDLAKGQEIARNVISKLKDAGVTTVILSTDPLVPKNLTEEATAQDYHPEWVIGPTVLVDTTFFSRTYDQEQWSHAFGITLPAARAERELGDSYVTYEWYFGKEPLVNTQAVVYPGPWQLMTGIHLAGPKLTPETFRDGLFRFTPPPPGPTRAAQSWGHDLWGRDDYNASDDAGAIWYDADAQGESETGQMGSGMLMYVDGGERYLPFEWPEDEIRFFDPEGAVAIYDERPAEDDPPDYPPWPGSPADQG